MSIEIRVPTLGESVTEATIGKWYKNVGDHVKVDEPLVELETDKVSVDVPSPVSGTLGEILAKVGDTVGVDGLLGTLKAGEGKAGSDVAAGSMTVPESYTSASQGQAASDTPSSRSPSPSAAKMMAENSLSAQNIAGSGKQGQILKTDVLAAIAGNLPAMAPAISAAAVPAKAIQAAGEERVRMTKLRQTIAKRLKDVQNTAAILTTFNEVDMSAVMELRKRYRDVFETKHGVKLGFMGLFTKAVCHALHEIPAINAEIDGDDIVYKNYAHIGIAVGTDKGLVVPVVRDANTMSIAEIEKEIGRLGRLARDGKLTIGDMRGGTFTITNGGIYGSLMSTPIINAPQSAILGMHAIKERPIVLGGQVVIRPMMYLALSYDHRIVDGQEAVTFLVRIKESLENPERLVLDL